MQKKSFNFTRNRLRALLPPENGRVDYKDTSTKGLWLRITSSGVMTFSYRERLNGRDKRVTIGDFSQVSVQQAQIEACNLRNMLHNGIDPNKSSKLKQSENTTLGECLADYLKLHNSLAASTAKQYKREINKHLKKWLNKPLKEISRSEIANKHMALSKKSPALSNRVMRVLRALFNFASHEYENENGQRFFSENPVTILSHKRLWNKIERRTGVIKTHQLQAWIRATEALPKLINHGETLRDYLQLLLFTGLRLTEALTLKWEAIDFDDRTLTVEKTKNKKVHKFPLSGYLFSLLKNRYTQRTSIFVFPAYSGAEHLCDPKKGILKVRELTGLTFTPHDLRRTFTTIAESLDLSTYVVKRLLNHSMADDVTAGYIVWDVERIRKPMQKITDYITKAAGIKESASLIDLSTRKVI